MRRKNSSLIKLFTNIFLYSVPIIVMLIELKDSLKLINTNQFNIREVPIFQVLFSDINSPGAITYPLEEQIVYFLQGFLIYSIIYLFNLSPSAIFPIWELVSAYISYIILLFIQKNVFKIYKLEYNLIFISVGNLYYILSLTIPNPFGNLTLSMLYGLFVLLIISKYLSDNITILKLIIYSVIISIMYLFMEINYLPVLPAIIAIVIILFLNKQNLIKTIKILFLSFIFFILISLPVTIQIYDGLIAAQNPIQLSYTASKVSISTPAFDSTFLQLAGLFAYFPAQSIKLDVMYVASLLVPVVLLAVSIILVNRTESINSLLVRLLVIIFIIILLYSKIYSDTPLINILIDIPLIGVLFYAISTYLVPQAVVSIIYSIGISVSLATIWSKIAELKSIKKIFLKELIVILLLIIAVMPSVSEGIIYYPMFNTSFSGPGNYAYVSNADNYAAYWLYTHDDNNGLVVWLPYLSYPLGIGYTFPFAGPNRVPYPLDGPSSSWYLDYLYEYVPKAFDSYVFAKLLSVAGIEYVVINRNYPSTEYTLNGDLYYNMLSHSKYFTLVFNQSNVYIFKNDLYSGNHKGILGYNFAGLYAMSLLSIIEKYDRSLGNITPIEADMVPMPNLLTYRGVLIFGPDLNEANYIVVNLIFSNKTLENEAIIITPRQFNNSIVMFSTNVFSINPFLYGSYYQYSYNINYGFLVNWGGVNIYSTQFSGVPSDYVMLVRYYGTGESKVVVNNETFTLKPSPSGFNWYSFNVSLENINNNLSIELNGFSAINLIIFIKLNTYENLLKYANSILRSYPIIYVEELNKGSKLYVQWLKNTTNLYIIPVNGISYITVNTSKFTSSYVVDNASKITYTNITSLLISTNTTVIVGVVSGFLNNSTPTIVEPGFFTWPPNVISMNGSSWVSYPYLGISKLYIPCY